VKLESFYKKHPIWFVFLTVTVGFPAFVAATMGALMLITYLVVLLIKYG
jgi:hypothetical protein